MSKEIIMIILAIFVFLGVSNSYEIEKVPGIPPKGYWDKFVILIWQHQTDVRKDLEVYRSVNINGFHIDGSSKHLAKFSRENNIPFYVDHAGGKGYLYLKKEDVDKIKKKLSVVERPNSLKDEKVMAKIKGLLKNNISDTMDGLVLAYAFDDEISTGSFTSPIETDGSLKSIEAYHKYQQDVFGRIRYMEPTSFEDVRKTLDVKRLSKWDLSKWTTWRSYMDTYFAEALLELTKYANSIDPTTPAGFVGGHQPACYGGMDYTKLTKVVQWMEAYDINGTNEILRSFWKKEKPRMVTWFNAGDPYIGSWFLWYYMVHGNRGVIAWPENSLGPWFKNGQPQPWLLSMKDTIREVQEFSKPILDLSTEFEADPIAIYYSQPTIQVGWAMDSIVHGNTWPNRSSSLDNDNSTSGRNRVAWFKLLEDCGYQYNVVSFEHIKDENFSKQYRVLILDRILALSEKEAEAIKKFLNNGGIVIADYLTGIFDEEGKGRSKGILDEIFSIKRDESKGYFDGKTVTEINGELYESPFLNRLSYNGAIRWNDIVVAERGTVSINGNKKAKVGDADVVIQNAVGNGKTYYLNLTPVEYTAISKRTSEYGKNWRNLVKEIFIESGIKPRVIVKESKVKLIGPSKLGDVRKKVEKKVEVIETKESLLTETIFWKKDNTYYLCIVKNPTTYGGDIVSGNLNVEGLDIKSDSYIQLEFDKPVKKIKNLRTEENLGEGNKFIDKWKTFQANIYELEF
jgi:hypothetical protein